MTSCSTRRPRASRSPTLHRDGLPAFGTCAGMILLATRGLDGRPDQRPLGVSTSTVRRNGYGRQRDSFEARSSVAGLAGGAVPGRVHPRAVVERVGADVEVLAEHDGRPGARRVRAACWSPRSIPSSRATSVSTNCSCDACEAAGRWRHVRSFQVAFDQAQEGRGRRGARQALRRLIRQIEVAARRAAATPTPTRRCATMVQRRATYSVPDDTIERAIKRGDRRARGRHLRGGHLRGLRPRAASR